jgi:KAP family P-loop domain
MNMSDRAIAERSEDVLGRWGIAKTIYDLIASSQTASALRIAVYGGWGEGKTSVLRFVETLAVKGNIPVCWFSVWAAQTQPDLWAGLFDALQSLPRKSDRWGKFKALTGKAAASLQHGKTSPAHNPARARAATELLAAPLTCQGSRSATLRHRPARG